MIKKLTVFLYYILFILTPFVMFSRTSELFEFNKMIFIYYITTFILFLFLVQKILTRNFKFRHGLVLLPFFIFLFTQILAALFSIDVHTSIWGYYGRFNGGLISIVSYLTLFYIGYSVIEKQQIERLLKAGVISSFFVFLWGLPGKLGHDISCLIFKGVFNNTCWTDQFRPAERMFSTLGQPNWLGAYLVINFCISIFFIYKSFLKKSRCSTLFYSFLSLSLYSGILFTRSRSALLAVWICLLSLIPLLLNFNRISPKNKIDRKIFLYFLFIIVFLTVVFKTGIDRFDKYLSFSFYVNNIFSKKLPVGQKVVQTVSQPPLNSEITESFDIRKIVWKGALELVKKYPLTGTGVETFAYSYYFVRPQEHNLTSEWDYLYNKAHNEYLNYLATTGILGELAYLTMIAVTIYLFIKKIKGAKGEDYWFYATIFLSYLSILVTNFFGFSTTVINIFFYLLPVVLFLSTEKSKKKSDVEKFSASKREYVTLSIMSLIFLFIIFKISTYYIADLLYSQSESYAKAEDYKSAAVLLQRALSFRNEHVYEDKISVYLANLAFIASYQKDKTTSKNLIDLSDYYNKHSLQASPFNVLYWKTKAKNDYLFYQSTLNIEYIKQAISSLVEAQKLSPTDPKIPYSVAIFYSLLQEGEKDVKTNYELQRISISSINESISLKPDYEDAYMMKGQLLLKFGKNKEAKDVFQYVLEHINGQNGEAKTAIEKL